MNPKLTSLKFVRANEDAYRAVLAQIKIGTIDHLSVSQLLHQNELTYFETLKSEKRKTEYLLGRYTAKTALQQLALTTIPLCDIEIGKNIFTAPIVLTPELCGFGVSISHTEHWVVAVAFPTQHPVAIDCESLVRSKTASAAIKRWINPMDIPLIQAKKETESTALIMAFSAKEALSKILGTGLMAGKEVYTFKTIEEQDTKYVYYFKHIFQYKVLSWCDNACIYSLAMPKNSEYKTVIKQ